MTWERFPTLLLDLCLFYHSDDLLTLRRISVLGCIKYFWYFSFWIALLFFAVFITIYLLHVLTHLHSVLGCVTQVAITLVL